YHCSSVVPGSDNAIARTSASEAISPPPRAATYAATTVGRSVPWSDHTAAWQAPVPTGCWPLQVAILTKIN
ncbi:MAG TPA: hypothetical protein VK575_06395, partial [Gemmatimonadaceae bacterium]|nr:hypothetical protein [Gemmatimonadaceae bacterium]